MSTLDKGYPLVLRLILAQLVIEQGTEAFRLIAESLERHPMLKDVSERKMTATRCRSLYLQMLRNEGLDLNSGDAEATGDNFDGNKNKESGASPSPPSSSSSSSVAAAATKKKKVVTPELRLAQILYMAYTEELIQEIHNDETEFVATYRELEDLQKQAERA